MSGLPIRQVINAYGNGGFRVSGVAFQGPILIVPTRTVAWTVADADRLAVGDFVVMVKDGPALELLLVGTGTRQMPISAEIRQFFASARIGLEVMDTGAACRTHNVLSAEGRRVGAALIPVG